MLVHKNLLLEGTGHILLYRYNVIMYLFVLATNFAKTNVKQLTAQELNSNNLLYPLSARSLTFYSSCNYSLSLFAQYVTKL